MPSVGPNVGAVSVSGGVLAVAAVAAVGPVSVDGGVHAELFMT